MLFLLITCISFIFFYKSLLLKPLPHWAYETRLLTSPICFWKEVISFFHISKLIKKSSSQSGCGFFHISPKMSMKKQTLSSKVVEAIGIVGGGGGGGEGEVCVLLDLPELVLESILERLPPDGLCSMACVCSELRDRCMSDRLWERHMKQKWGGVMGQAAYRQWQEHIAAASTKDSCFPEPSGQQQIRGGLMRSLSRLLWPLSLFRSNFDNNNKWSSSSSLPNNSIMSWYLALETGKFLFPAQVYNRENGHVGFLLSCYDADLCYDSRTDTFQARYQPHGRRAPAVENCVTWDRLRAPPIDTTAATAHDLHISDCLNELRPGDHIEIQWRRNKEFPYGWWYGVVGHLESCDGSHNSCRCHENDTIVLEFNQYTRGSRWRTTSVNRKDHREEGNEADGFYGGIRKLCSNNEISMWRRLWPAQVLE